jgi:hypothetical protein
VKKLQTSSSDQPRARRWSIFTLAGVILMTMVLWASPAQAAEKDCVVFYTGSCTSGSVAAYSNHTVWFDIVPTADYGCSYRIRDVANWQVVRSGYILYGWSSTLRNVYSRYRLEMSCPIAGWGTIHGA